MSEKKEKRNVIFRRIHGRIVPIAVGGGLVAAGHKLGSEKVYNRMNAFSKSAPKAPRSLKEFGTANDFTLTNKFTSTMQNKYGNALAAHKVNAVVFRHPALLPWEQRTSLLKVVDRATDADLGSQILIRSPSRFSFLHELGHAKLQNTGHWSARLREKLRPLQNFDEAKHFNFPKIMKWSGPNTIKRKLLISKPVQKLAAFGGKQVRAIGMTGLAAEETMAWVHGAKFLRTPRQKIAMLKYAIKPLSSYTNFPMQQFGRLALLGAGAATIGYGLLKKDKKK